jgi:hypothetical protein
MGLERFTFAMGRIVGSSRERHLFEAAREREPVLRQHRDLCSVLATLSERDEQAALEREELVGALVREHQRSTSSYWAMALLVAFAPMLRALRGRLRGTLFGPEELDQLVLEGFLEALRRHPGRSTSAAARLRSDTCRFVFRALEREAHRTRNQQELERCARGNAHFDLYLWRSAPSPMDADEQAEMEEMLRVAVGDELPSTKLEVVIATLLWRQPLTAYAGERARSGETPAGAYQRLKRERHRTLGRLRGLLTERLSPFEGELALGMQATS